MSAAVMLAAMASCSCLLVAGLLVAASQSDEGPGGGSGGGSGGKGFNQAAATYYYSYPQCCKGSPAYDPSADKTECTAYSGCKYQGLFAGADGKKSYDYVKNNNIVALFKAGENAKTWRSKWANKTVRLRNPDTGKTLDAVVLDTCGDQDCGGCCTRNAEKGGGTLIDLEYNTALRFWGSNVPGTAKIEYSCLDCE